MKNTIKSTLTSLLIFAIASSGLQAWGTNIHWDIIETGAGPGTETLSTDWGGTGDAGITITPQGPDDWLIDLDASHALALSTVTQISWHDLTAGLFNRLTKISDSQFRYESDLASAPADVGPFNLGVSHYAGRTSAGDDVFASAHEVFVPEPSTLALGALGLLGIGYRRRK
jgi:hypothetical protein